MMLIVLLIAPLLVALEIPKCPEPELKHGTKLKVREKFNPEVLFQQVPDWAEKWRTMYYNL